MKKEIVYDSYYSGFEGEPEIAFVFENSDERHILKMWTGYFDTMLDLMCQYEPFNDGILHEYYAHEGWYEESPWELTNLNAAIQLFKSFNLQKVNENTIEASPNIVPTLPEVASEIAQFLEQAKSNESNAYIIYE